MLALLTLALATTLSEGDRVWRFDLEGPATSQPAISADGRIAIGVEGAVVVLDAAGSLVQRLTGTRGGQPMWDGEALWIRTEAGWTRIEGESTFVCPTNADHAVLDERGNLVWAGDLALETCDPEPRTLVERQARPGQVLPFAGGWATVDEWWFELFDASLARTARHRADEVGIPVGLDGAGRLVVVHPSTRLRLLEPSGQWTEGPRGVGGTPVTAHAGLVVPEERGVALSGHWRLPITAGVRQVAALADGSVAVLERAGRLGLVREGRPVWVRTLKEPGQILGAHPAGLLLVQEGRELVAFRAPPPDPRAPWPVAGGLSRSWRATPPTALERCEPQPPKVAKGVLAVTGPGVKLDGQCLYPTLETPCSDARCSRAGRLLGSKDASSETSPGRDAAWFGDVVTRRELEADDLLALGDGTLAVLSKGAVRVLWPDRSVRWSFEPPQPCEEGGRLKKSEVAAELEVTACSRTTRLDLGWKR